MSPGIEPLFQHGPTPGGVTDIRRIRLIYEKFGSIRGSSDGSRHFVLDYEVLSAGSDWLELKGQAQHLEAPVFLDGAVVLAPGDMVHRFEPLNEWYNASVFLAPDGKPRGIYCDVRRTTERCLPETITFKDLLLDIWVFPGGEPRLLDEDELEAALRAGWVLADEYESVVETAKALMEYAGRGRFLSWIWPRGFECYGGK